MRLGMDANVRQAKRREYTRENRELWKSLGFRMLSAMTHDDDRTLVLAELDVRKASRMAHIASDADTGMAVLVQLGRRNLTPCPKPKVMKEFLEEHRRKDNYYEIEDAVNNAIAAYKKVRGIAANFDNAGSEVSRQRMFAKEVAFGNLAAACWRLANVRAELGDVTKNVFNAEGSEVNPVRRRTLPTRGE